MPLPLPPPSSLRLRLLLPPLLLLLPELARCAPVPFIAFEGEEEPSRPTDLQLATRYLRDFGYYGSDEGGAQEGRRFADALRRMRRRLGVAASAGAALDRATLDAMALPRCGEVDEAGSPPGIERVWLRTDLTYRVVGETGDLERAVVEGMVARAMAVWSSASLLRFSPAPNGQRPDISISFHTKDHGDGRPFDGPGGVVSHLGGDSRGGVHIHVDDDEFWTFGEGRVVKTRFGTARGDFCIFPFAFGGRLFHTCTASGRDDGLPWCSATDDYDRDRRFGFCPHEEVFTVDGNGEGAPCVFPFVYGGREYSACTSAGRDDAERWCATTANYDADHKYGFCPPSALTTVGGNADGAPCVFPFRFLGRSYETCTAEGRADGQLWCATTDSYDAHRKWGLCPAAGLSLFLALVHAVGDALGLSHSEEPGAATFPVLSYRRNFQLSPADESAVRDLYGEPRVGDSATDDARARRKGPEGPGLCDDAVAVGAAVQRGETTIVFKGGLYWELVGPGGVPRGPFPIARRWPGAPPAVQAASGGPGPDDVTLYAGSLIWRFSGGRLVEAAPRPLPGADGAEGPAHIDAAFYSRRWQSHLVFSGHLLWRYDSEMKTMQPGSPRRIRATFAGLPASIDAAFERDGLAYFIKGHRIWQYNGRTLTHQGFFNSDWLGCIT
uniref:72 kDa type IV collagenase-like n=1 Tax=Petromyzon marinus TaxID=7757 RepID=A0AAJ7UEF8_PETMA|nr:72 kDa type IV collagenase-like [Petromyzon marinus]